MTDPKQQRLGFADSTDTGASENRTPYVCQPELLGRIASFLPPNDVACGLRLLNKAASEQFTSHNVIWLSQPFPSNVSLETWGPPDSLRSCVRRLNLQQRQRLLCLIAARGSLDNLRVAIAVVGFFPFAAVPEAAAAAGQLHVCLWLKQQGWPLGSSLAAAAGAGHRSVCEGLLANGCDRDSRTTDDAAASAARGGHVPLMEWLMQELHREPLQGLFLEVVAGCDLPTVQRLYGSWRSKLRISWPKLLAAAAGSPTADWRSKVEWLEGEQSRCVRAGVRKTPVVCTAAASRPDAVDRLGWLRQHGYPADGEVVVAAARAGHAAAVQYLLGEAAVRVVGDWQRSTLMLGAAEGGHLAVLQVLHSHGWYMGPIAASGGHLAVMEWFVDTFGAEGLQLDDDLVYEAVESGSVRLLTWLRERGCAWDDNTLQYAAGSGCEEALEWLVEQGCPMPGDGEPYVVAARTGDEAMLRCLRRLGVPWGPHGRVFNLCATSVGTPASAGFVLPALHWLLEAGCPVDWEEAIAMAVAARPRASQRGTRSALAEVEAWLRSERPNSSSSSE